MRKFVVLVAAAAVCAAAHAAPPTEASVNALLVAGKTEKVLDGFYTYVTSSMRQGMRAALKDKQLTEAQQKALDGIPTKYEQVMREELSWEKLRPMYVQIYQETFTQGEIDGLTAFYKSPTGAAYIDKMPVVMQKSQKMMQEHFAPLAARMNAAVEQAITEARAAK